jgi:hypothetical protein
MKAGIIIDGAGSILILSSCESFEDQQLVEALRGKGITKYIAFEVPVDLVKKNYGQHFAVTLSDRQQTDILRVVDVDGKRIFNNFPLQILSRPLCHEEPILRKVA